MLKIPENIAPYVDFDDGVLIAVDLPPELASDFERFKRQYEELKADPLADY